jgi:hypothetical protein
MTLIPVKPKNLNEEIQPKAPESRRGGRNSRPSVGLIADHIEHEIRKLNRIDKIEICRWIDQEVADDLVWRIGMSRSIELRQQMEQKRKVSSPKRRVHIGNSEQDSVGYSAQPTPGC